jgi:hypothetical protein
MLEYGKGIGEGTKVDSIYPFTFMGYLVGAKLYSRSWDQNNSHVINSLLERQAYKQTSYYAV